MRSATTAQNTALAGPYYTVGLRVLIADSDSNMRDWSNQGGVNWIDQVEIDADVDQPVNGATITLRREAGGTKSLAPFRTDSTLNRNNASAYAPAIDVGRLVIIQVATVAAGTTPVTGDFIELFRGYVDRVTWAASAMTLTCRDIGAANADRYVKQKQTYGTDTGVPVEDVMQAILVDWGDGSTLYVPTSPSFNITTYEQQANQSVIDALLALAQTCGWTVRTIWNPTAGAFQLALLDPQRTKSTPDQTIGPSRYLAVRDLFVDRTNIRNDFTLNYTDASTGPTSMALSDGASQAQYGYRWMGITESSTSPINTATEASAMLTAICADLKDPKAEQEIELHFDWRIEINDLLKFQANGIHYDTDQAGAVVTFRHLLTPTQQRTTVRTRGAPAGQYLNWFQRGIGTPISQGPNLAVAAKQSGTNYVITWSGDDVSLSTDGGTTWATPSASPITVAMNAPGGVSKVYVFKGYRDGVAIQIPVTIPAQSGSTAPSLSLTPSIASTQADDSSGSVTLTLSATNLPTAYTWTLYSGYTRGKLTTILASGSQSSNPLSGNPTVSVTPAAKLIQWATLVVTVGSDTYTTDVVVNPYQPAFSTGGAVKRAVPFDDGGTSAAATDSAGHVLHTSVADAGSRQISRFLAKNLSGDPDTVDGLIDGNTYGRASYTRLGYADRAGSGLDSSGWQVQGVRDAALIAGRRAGTAGRAQFSSVFTEDWSQDPSATWALVAGATGATWVRSSGSGSTRGGTVLAATRQMNCNLIDFIPFDATKLYRFRARIYVINGNVPTYLGVIQNDYNGNRTNANSGAGYILTEGINYYGQGWVPLTTWVRGASQGYGTTTLGTGGSPESPIPLNAGTVSIAPYMLLNYGDTSGIQTQVDFYEITEYDEDGQSRVYTISDPSGRLANQRRAPMTTIGGNRAGFFVPGSSTQIATPLTADGVGNITVAAFDAYVGSGGAVSYAQGTCIGTASASPGTKNYVYGYDPTYAGGNISWYATTDARSVVNQDGLIYAGSIVCVSGSGGTGTPPGGACPAPETLILLADGSTRPAGEVRVGDLLDTQHEHTLARGAYRVTHASTHLADRWRLVLADGRVLIATPNHRVHAHGRGWTRLDTLCAGDVITGTPCGVVVSAHPCDRGPVVKLTIEDAHTYMSAGLLSHNTKVQ